MSLHIVTCAPDYLPHVGGAEIGLHSLLRRVGDDTGHAVSVVVPTDQGDLPRHEVLDGVAVRRFRRPRRWMRWYAPTAACLTRLPLIVRGAQPDVVHLSYALPSGPGGAVGAHLAGVPYVLSLGGNDVTDPIYPPPPRLQAVARRLAHRARRVICWTSPVRSIVVDDWRVDPDRVSVNPFGVDTDRFTPMDRSTANAVRAAWGLGPDDAVVLALQRMERRKGVDILLEAVARVVRPGRRLVVVLAGDGRERAALARQATRLGLDEAVHFVGTVSEEDKRGLLAMADLVVLASRHEGQGIVIAESAASGTPVVATDRGGTIDMIDHGRTGALVPAEDPDALARALTAALADPDRLQRWGEAARAKAERELSLAVTARRFAATVTQAAD